MKQLCSSSQMANLSPVAKKRLHHWLQDKDYGSHFDGEFTPLTQLPIGIIIEFLLDHDAVIPPVTRDWCDDLFDTAKEILEQKN